MPTRFASLAFTLYFAFHGHAKLGAQTEPTSATAPQAKPDLLRVFQDQRVSTAYFDSPLTLAEALEFLAERYAAQGFEVPISVDLRAFQEAKPDVDDVYETIVELHFRRKELTGEQLLQQLLARMPVKATYIAKGDLIVIVPEKTVSRSELMRKPVATTFVNRPLREAVNELAIQARVTVVIDGRVGEIADQRVSATLRPGATLFDSLLILSDMAKLRPAVLANSIYITTPARARALEAESARQLERLGE